jgi:hypothetical protein
MSEEPPATPPSDEPPAEPPPDDELAGLSDDARRLVERANSDAARSRHDLRRAQAELERIQRDHESEQERAIREAEERGRTAELEERAQIVAGYERRLAIEVVRARAGVRFADPDDAVAMLDLDALLAEQDPARRAQKVDQALEKLLEEKPYLGKDGRGRGPLVTQGGRSGEATRPRERSWLRG